MTPLAFEPLSDEEIDELDHFMLHEVNCDEGMTLDMLDGYLHAIAIGPKTLMPRQWMPLIWGKGDSMMPPVESIEKLNQILGLIMRMFNSVISGLEEDPPEIYPHWCAQEYRGREYDDAEGWAYGFTQGVHLCQAEWAPLLQTPQGQAWYRPRHQRCAASWLCEFPKPSLPCTGTGCRTAARFTSVRLQRRCNPRSGAMSPVHAAAARSSRSVAVPLPTCIRSQQYVRLAATDAAIAPRSGCSSALAVG